VVAVNSLEYVASRRLRGAECCVATFGFDATGSEVIRAVCVALGAPHYFGWSVMTIVDLVRTSSERRPDVLVLDCDALGADLPAILAEVHAVSPDTSMLVVGEPSDIEALSKALRTGLRGIVPRKRLSVDLARAITAISRHELWLSRTVTAALLGGGKLDRDPDLDDARNNLPSLSEREFSVLHEVLKGLTNKDTGRALGISEQTVKIHLQSIYRKLRVHRRIDLMLLHGSVAR